MTTAPPTAYPTYAAIRARRLAERRAEAKKALLAVEPLAEQAGGHLLVFGSLVEGGFDERSDLDVAVCGLPAPADSQIAAEIDTALALAGFTADVVPERFMGPTLRERVMCRGRGPRALG